MDYAMISSVWIYIYHNKSLSIRVYKKKQKFLPGCRANNVMIPANNESKSNAPSI